MEVVGGPARIRLGQLDGRAALRFSHWHDGTPDRVLAAVKTVGLQVPLVVRLEGTNVELGKQIIRESGLNVIAADDLDDAAKKIVAAVRG